MAPTNPTPKCEGNFGGTPYLDPRPFEAHRPPEESRCPTPDAPCISHILNSFLLVGLSFGCCHSNISRVTGFLFQSSETFGIVCHLIQTTWFPLPPPPHLPHHLLTHSTHPHPSPLHPPPPIPTTPHRQIQERMKSQKAQRGTGNAEDAKSQSPPKTGVPRRAPSPSARAPFCGARRWRRFSAPRGSAATGRSRLGRSGA